MEWRQADMATHWSGRWLLCCKDDASRFVVGYGVFDHATTENTLAVPERPSKIVENQHPYWLIAVPSSMPQNQR